MANHLQPYVFMRKVACIKLTTQNCKGTLLWNNWIYPISTLVRCLLSTLPVCSRVYGQENWWTITYCWRCELNFWIKVSLEIFLKGKKTVDKLRLFLKRIKPRIMCVIIYKASIISKFLPGQFRGIISHLMYQHHGTKHLHLIYQWSTLSEFDQLSSIQHNQGSIHPNLMTKSLEVRQFYRPQIHKTLVIQSHLSVGFPTSNNIWMPR